ncbi:MAG: hypothetical protein EXR79_01655 [Myxococcales bacterium]|nr:hypothetical protein [Myxococcales bacterium]
MGAQSTMAPRGPATQTQSAGTTPGGAGGGAAAPAAAGAAPAAPQPLSREVIQAQIVSKLPDYAEGAPMLAGKWEAEQLTQETLDRRTADEAGTYIHLLRAWKEAKGTDEAFVKDFGKNDPIATQKFADIAGEQYYEGSIEAARTQFYADVAGKLLQPKQARDRVFPILQSAASPFQKKGKLIPPEKLGEFGSRAQGLPAYLEAARQGPKMTELDNEALEMLAAAAGHPSGAALTAINPNIATTWMAPGVNPGLELLKLKLSQGVDPLPYANKGMGLTRPGGTLWFTPDKVKVDADPDTGFGELMTIFALQPEWYPGGSLAIKVKTAGEGAIRNARKPTAFDGIMSALWVSRNQPEQAFGVTGGGAREYVAEEATWGAVESAQAQTISSTFQAELKKMASQYRKGNSAGGTSPTSATEERLRGNTPAPAAPNGAQALQSQIIGKSRAEATSPSRVPGQANTNANGSRTGAAVPGGTFTPR